MLPGNVPVGRRIDNRYRVDGYFGGGKNGEVYDVWDTRQDRRAALKLLNPQRLPAGPWVEAQILTSLSGNYILPILNASDDAGVPYLVTEVMENGTVEDQVVPGIGMDVNRAAEWIRQACIGVARVHDRGLVHADIKAGNLFLDGDNNVLVGDFGLAARMNPAGYARGAGSPETMAPEIPKTGHATVRTDVYSLGATLYHLLAGQWMNPALNALTDWNQLLAAVDAHGAPRPLGEVAPHVPVGFRAIVMRALEPDPTIRYATAAELAAALGARTTPPRTWNRDAPCVGHTMCFTGTRPEHATFKVCAVPVGNRGSHVLQATRTPAGTRINPWPRVTPGQFVGKVRARLAALT
jgi:eukaryotic-like serine/threonine-protein kinase